MSKKAIENGNFVALTKCFLCGESKDIILDRRFRDISEIHGKAIDKEPCPECEKKLEQGIMIIECRDGESGENPYRTGRLWVITEEAADRLFTGFDFTKNRIFFMEESIAEQIGFHEQKPTE